MASLSPQQFLEKNTDRIPPVSILFGSEEQLLDEVRHAARRHFGERELVTAESLTATGGGGLFGGGAAVLTEVIISGKPDKHITDCLLTRVKQTTEPDALLVVFYELDYKAQKTAWFKQLTADAVCVNAAAVPARRAAFWVNRWLQQEQLTLNADAVSLLCAQTEGNLAAARQVVAKLGLADKTDGDENATKCFDENASRCFDESIVRRVLTDGARYDVFDLTDAVLAGKRKRALSILPKLLAEGVAAPLILWSLSDLLGALFACREGSPVRYWGERLNNLRAVATASSDAKLRRLLAQAAFIDRVIKGVDTGDAELLLTDFALRLAALRDGVKISLPRFQP